MMKKVVFMDTQGTTNSSTWLFKMPVTGLSSVVKNCVCFVMAPAFVISFSYTRTATAAPLPVRPAEFNFTRNVTSEQCGIAGLMNCRYQYPVSVMPALEHSMIGD